MTTLHQLLTDADPLRNEAAPGAERRDAMRRQIVALPPASARRSGVSRRFVLVAMASGVLLVMLSVLPMWMPGEAALHAAMQFEVRLADTETDVNMPEPVPTEEGRTIYIHRDILLTNADIADTRVVALPEGFGVEVELTAAGAAKMRSVTTDNIGRLLAIMVDGAVLAAPRIRASVDEVGLITGDFTEEEAERLAEGVRALPQTVQAGVGSAINPPLKIEGVAQAPRLRVGGEVKAPLKIKHVDPVYPEDAKDAGVQGLVILEILIGTDGRVLDTKILRSVPLLDGAAIRAVTEWLYKPTVVADEPVELLMTVTINFLLPQSHPNEDQR